MLIEKEFDGMDDYHKPIRFSKPYRFGYGIHPVRLRLPPLTVAMYIQLS
jgi:hypothetical protein